jgi:hypothetical protein
MQGANGLVRSTGDGYWLFNDVLMSYTPTAPASKPRGWLALAIALPVVLGSLLLAGGVALAWCIRKRRSRWGLWHTASTALCVALAFLHSPSCRHSSGTHAASIPSQYVTVCCCHQLHVLQAAFTQS